MFDLKEMEVMTNAVMLIWKKEFPDDNEMSSITKVIENLGLDWEEHPVYSGNTVVEIAITFGKKLFDEFFEKEFIEEYGRIYRPCF